MYSCLTLGRNGRFGNQMFQYAALFSLAKTNSQDFFIPNDHSYELLEAFPNLSAKIESSNNVVSFIDKRYREKSFVFEQRFFSCPPKTDVFGYFQSDMYFNDFANEILAEFKFADRFFVSSSNKIAEIKKLNSTQNLCSLHVRRGDYLNLADFHINLSNNFYESAIYEIKLQDENAKFLIFSDDLEWCKNNFKSDDFIFSNGQNQFEDMCMMSLCDYHVIANSSFSWWGSYLANSKLTIAPRQWFGSRGPQNWNTIYRKDWITV